MPLRLHGCLKLVDANQAFYIRESNPTNIPPFGGIQLSKWENLSAMHNSSVSTMLGLAPVQSCNDIFHLIMYNSSKIYLQCRLIGRKIIVIYLHRYLGATHQYILSYNFVPGDILCGGGEFQIYFRYKVEEERWKWTTLRRNNARGEFDWEFPITTNSASAVHIKRFERNEFRRYNLRWGSATELHNWLTRMHLSDLERQISQYPSHREDIVHAALAW